MCNLSWCSVILLAPHTWQYSRSISLWWRPFSETPWRWRRLRDHLCHEKSPQTSMTQPSCWRMHHFPSITLCTVMTLAVAGSGWWENCCCSVLKCLPLSSPCLNIIWIQALEKPLKMALQKHNKDTGNEILTEGRFHEVYVLFITDWIWSRLADWLLWHLARLAYSWCFSVFVTLFGFVQWQLLKMPSLGDMQWEYVGAVGRRRENSM